MRSISKDSKGLTLAELLIVSAVLAVVSLAVYSITDNGIKIWQRLNQKLPEEDLNICFEKFVADLRNTARVNGIVFSGEETEFKLATLVNCPWLSAKVIGEASYYYDNAKQALNRRERDVSDIYNQDDGRSGELLNNVSSLNFSYYFYDEERKDYVWKKDFSGAGLPLAVRLELELNDGKKTRNFIKTVTIPVSG